jgi:hypothetical protein
MALSFLTLGNEIPIGKTIDLLKKHSKNKDKYKKYLILVMMFSRNITMSVKRLSQRKIISI